MNKKDKNTQTKINIILIIAIIALALYSAFLTHEVLLDRSASESRDSSIMDIIFKMQVDEANNQSGN
jgi:hypothetical protein